MLEVLLNSRNLPGFAHLIPPPLMRELEDGDLVGVGGVDPDWPEEAPMAVLLCRVRRGWMEIVWLAADPAYRGIDAAGWLLDMRLAGARGAGFVWGAVADLPSGEARPAIERVLTRRGFTLTEVTQPVYAVTMEALQGNELLSRPLDRSGLVPLGQADNRLRAAALLAIGQDPRPVPLAQPVDWSRYDPELSAFSVREGKPCGLCLVTREEESLTLALLWAVHRQAPSLLLSHAAQRAVETCPGETQVVVPTVTEGSARIVAKLFPDAAPQRVTQARLIFHTVSPVLTDWSETEEVAVNA